MRQRWFVILLPAVLLALAACGGSDDEGAAGPMLAGRDTYGSICSACHGATGQGGVGPALDAVLETFPDCETQVRWVTLGSEEWKAEVGPTYGATDKPVMGGMPRNGATLGDEEIRAVVVYERVRFGGLDEATAVADCGAGPGA